MYPKRGLQEKETCPRCKETIACSKSLNCWCYGVDIRDSVLDTLELKYEGCLCVSCLKELHNKPGEI